MTTAMMTAMRSRAPTQPRTISTMSNLCRLGLEPVSAPPPPESSEVTTFMVSVLFTGK